MVLLGWKWGCWCWLGLVWRKCLYWGMVLWGFFSMFVMIGLKRLVWRFVSLFVIGNILLRVVWFVIIIVFCWMLKVLCVLLCCMRCICGVVLRNYWVSWLVLFWKNWRWVFFMWRGVRWWLLMNRVICFMRMLVLFYVFCCFCVSICMNWLCNRIFLVIECGFSYVGGVCWGCVCV